MLLIKIAWRSLWRNQRRTLITLFSIILGTAFALFFVGIQLGVYDKLVEEAVRMNAGHVSVEHIKYADAPSIDLFVPSVSEVRRQAAGIRGIEQIKPLVIGQAMISTGAGSAGVGMLGVEPEAEKKSSPLAKKIVEGRYLETGDERGVILGASLAERLKLETGKKLVLTTNDVNGELVSEMLRVTGTYRVGVEEVDSFLVQVPIDVARRILSMGPDEATRVGVVLDQPKYQEKTLEMLRKRLAGMDVSVLPWQEVMAELAGFIAVDVGSNYVFQGIIIFIIGFTILNTILMSVLERNREFATLLALGTSPVLLRLQVVLESIFIGFLGTAFGLLLGGAANWYFHVYGLDFTSIYGQDTSVAGYIIDPVLHSSTSPGMFIWLGSIIFIMTVMLGLYPAWKSARISIPEVLRTH